MCAAAVGIVVMVSGGISTVSLYGNMMGLLTAFCFSCYAIIVRRYRGIEMLPALMVSGSVIIVISLVLRWGDLAVPLRDVLLC